MKNENIKIEKNAQQMKGADVLVTALEKEGVDVVFAYPGGASMELHQALTKSRKIRTILPRFEQGGGFMAHGYARSTGKPSVCMATSGPGATNLVTCIADAYMDSIPLIAITGQVYQQFIGKAAFQETDFYGMTLPIVKHSYLVLNEEELPKIVKEAFHIASSGRPGPVVIDIPKDVQQSVFIPNFPEKINIPGFEINSTNPKASDEEEEGFHLGRGHENGSLQVRTKEEPIVYKHKDFRPKGELMIWGYHDEYSSEQGFYEYYSVLSDTGVFDIKEHQVWYSFHNHKDHVKFAKDEFTLQVLRNFPFAIRGYAFKNKKLRNYYRRYGWYLPDPNCKLTAADLPDEELEWIYKLSVYEE